MRIKVDLDATPEELRRFFGLPDVQPLQEEVMRRMRERMLAGLDQYDPATLLHQVMGPSAPGFESLQKAFWEAFRQDPGEGDKK